MLTITKPFPQELAYIFRIYSPVDDVSIINTNHKDYKASEYGLSERAVVTEQQTPIEILLRIDSDNTVSSRNIYNFLELNPSNYSRWCKMNILNNPFSTENVDFTPFVIHDECGGQATTEYKCSISFAKKLCMLSKTERGEQARDYFIKVEDKLKELAMKNTQREPVQSSLSTTGKLDRLRIMELNALTQQAKLLYQMSNVKTLPTDQRNILVIKAAELLLGVPVLPSASPEQLTLT